MSGNSVACSGFKGSLGLAVYCSNGDLRGLYRVRAAITGDQFTKIMKLLADAGCSTAILTEVEHMLTNSNPDLGMDARPRRAPASFASRYPDAMKIGFAW